MCSGHLCSSVNRNARITNVTTKTENCSKGPCCNITSRSSLVFISLSTSHVSARSTASTIRCVFGGTTTRNGPTIIGLDLKARVKPRSKASAASQVFSSLVNRNGVVINTTNGRNTSGFRVSGAFATGSAVLGSVFGCGCSARRVGPCCCIPVIRF